MENIISNIITNAPNLLGLAVLAYVLWRQNERMLTALLERVTALEEKVQALSASIDAPQEVKPSYIPF